MLILKYFIIHLLNEIIFLESKGEGKNKIN